MPAPFSVAFAAPRRPRRLGSAIREGALGAVLVSVVTCGRLVAAQPAGSAPPAQPRHVCFTDPQPAPACDAILVYEIGIYEPFAGSRASVAPDAGERRQPFVVGQHVGVEVGLLRNRGPQDAVGATLGGGVGDLGRVSAKARYRRWGVAPSGSRFAVDLAAGPVVSSVADTPPTGPAPTLGELDHPTVGGLTGDVSLELGGQFGAAVRGDALWVRGHPAYGVTGGVHTSSGSAVWVTVVAAVVVGVVLGTVF